MEVKRQPKIPVSEVKRLTLDALDRVISSHSDFDAGLACYGFEAELTGVITLVMRNEEQAFDVQVKTKADQGTEPGEVAEREVDHKDKIDQWLAEYEDKEVDRQAIMNLLASLRNDKIEVKISESKGKKKKEAKSGATPVNG